MPVDKESPGHSHYLQACRAQIQARLGWSDSSEWRHSHFERLSEEILDDTGIKLSAVTLKRLWGKVDYQSLPSTSTLDALAKFLGDKDWISFQQRNQAAAPARTPSKRALRQALRSVWRPAYLVPLAMLVVVVVLLASSSSKAVRYDSRAGSFSFEPVASGVPNTVIFDYEVRDRRVKKVDIQQSWDPRLRHEVDPRGHIFTTTYYYPGFFKAKLLLDEQVVSEKGLYVKSDGWMGTIMQDPVPFYLTYEQLQGPAGLEISTAHLTDQGLDLADGIPATNLHFVEDLGPIPGDHFQLRTTFRHTLPQGEAVCQQSSLLIVCSETPYILPFSIPGCVGELNVMLPGKYIKGQENDLSGFGVDFSDWVELEVTVLEGALTVKINQTLAFEETLAADPGQIVGVRYRFHGTGAVQSLTIGSPADVLYTAPFGPTSH